MAISLAALTKGSVEADVKPAVCSRDFSFQRQREAERVSIQTKREERISEKQLSSLASKEAVELTWIKGDMLITLAAEAP